MGGFGTWSLAAYQPKRLAAIVPICGGGEPFTTRLYSDVPAWVFHGAKDTVVPLERSERMVEALKKAGGNVKFTVYPEAQHDSWSESYANPELYEWLLQQKREAESQVP
jgi:predicted peptidase